MVSIYWRGLPLEREPDNPEDIHAVAIKKIGEVVGHVPFNLAPTVSAFLRRSTNKCLADVMGSKVNRGAGYGSTRNTMQVSLYFGPKDYIEKLETTCKKLQSDSLL